MVARLLSAVTLAVAWVIVSGDLASNGTESVAADETPEEQGANTFTPHDATEPLEAFNVILDIMNRELHSEHWQWLVTVAAFCFGVCAVCFPKEAFKNLTVGFIFAVMYTMAMGDLYERYKDQRFEGAVYVNGVMLWQVIVSIEVAGCASLVAWKGFEGVRQFLSMVIGVWPLKFLQSALVHSGIFGASPWWNIIVVTLSAALGFFLMRKDNLEYLLSYVFPLFGGKLISCSFGWFLFYLLDHTWSKAWLDFFHSLPLDWARMTLMPTPGIGWSTPSGAGPDWMGWAAGTVIWLGIALGSIVYHHKKINKIQSSGNQEPFLKVEQVASPRQV